MTDASVASVVTSIWSDVLKVDEASLDDEWFLLGGDSLLIVQMVERIDAALNVDVPIAAFFDDPTLGGLIARIESLVDAKATTPGA